MPTPKVSYAHPYGKHGAKALERVYLLEPNAEFIRIWQQTNPNQADLEALLADSAESVAGIADGERPTVLLPHIGIDEAPDAKIQSDFINGRHRFMTLRELGLPIPVLVDSNIAGDLSVDDRLQSFIKPLPAHLKTEIQGDEEGQSLTDEGMRDIIRRWVRENEERLRAYYRSKYGKFVGDKAFEYYAEHGVRPSNQDVERWKVRAQQLGQSIEPDQQALRFLQREEMREYFACFVGEEMAGRAADTALATGRPIHRDTIHALRDSNLSLEEAITREGGPAKVPVRGVEPSRPAIASRTVASVLQELVAQRQARESALGEPRNPRGPSRGSSGPGMGSR